MAQSEVIEILKKYILLLKSEGIVVDKAFLFGSYLLNTASEESDIDLMIVTENEYDDYLAGKVWALTNKINTKIEPFLIGRNKFNSVENSPLVQMIKSKGLEIV